MRISLIVFLIALLPSTGLFGQTVNVPSCQHLKHSPYKHAAAPHLQKSASVSISDSIDLIKHTLHLDLTDFSGFSKTSSCAITFEALVDGIAELPLDLKDQLVDSVTHTAGTLDFNYIGEQLTVILPAPLNAGEQDEITVHYRGGAVTDPSGFGGFYWSTGIAYNIGVAFTDWPPSYGRAWFPCFDNFVEKSQFEFQVLTSGGRSAYCNGYLESTTPLGGDTVLSTWILENEIPSYLASVAVSDYERTEWAFESISGDTIPVYLVAASDDLSGLENNFENLETVFHAFEDWFGPYRWAKIGFTMTPVGAMEHATNIAYPPSILGTNFAEPVMAHELAHEWFGNLATCSEPAEMWLNEGWAEFLSILAYEAISGPDEYISIMRANHREMLHKAHFLDGGYLTMNALPPSQTYGEHAYNKGACMAHTLRGYIGDALFFDAMEAYINSFAYQNASSEDLRDFLNSQPGIDVSDFFTDWIFQPGWAQFSVDQFTTTGSGSSYEVTLAINQRLKVAENHYQNVPVTLTLMDENWNTYEEQVVLSGPTTELQVTAPFEPVFATINRDDKLSLATTGEEFWLEFPALQTYNHAMCQVLTETVLSPVVVRVEHNWVGAGGTVANPGYLHSPDRYWRVGGLLDEDFSGQLRLEFDSRNTANGNLDIGLRELAGDDFNEENLVVLYRPNPDEAWQVWEDVELQTLGPTDNGYARLYVNGFTVGEYSFGYAGPNVGLNTLHPDSEDWAVFPNPASEFLTVEYFEPLTEPAALLLMQLDGKVVLRQSIATTPVTLDLGGMASGTYLLELGLPSGTTLQQKVIIR